MCYNYIVTEVSLLLKREEVISSLVTPYTRPLKTRVQTREEATSDMEYLLLGAFTSVVYLILHAAYDRVSTGSLQLPAAPVRRSMETVPTTVVPPQGQATQLRSARALINRLVDDMALSVAFRNDADEWLTDYDRTDADNQRLLKRAFTFLYEVEIGHKAVTSLSEEHAIAVSDWLTEYLGKEERA